MKDELISLFIDDEMTLAHKITFVEGVHADTGFKDETIGLLQQEKVLRAEVVDHVPAVAVVSKPHRPIGGWRTWGILAGGLATAILVLMLYFPSPQKASVPYRFVLYQPDVNRVEVAGSFSEWRTIPLQKTGTSGYWEVTLDLPTGEHRFSYIIDGQRRLADPTILSREQDDFGGNNSILKVNSQA